ncbi:MAG: DUF6056 family protein [Bacteroidales bacterium]|nr:DUF6056 family protein [Bacteroidales bacterium]
MAVFLYVLYMGMNALWMGDDLLYQSSFATGGTISSIGEICQSQVAHYFCQNGRFVAHFLVQFFLCLLPQSVFAIVNAAVYVTFILLVLAALRIKPDDTKAIAVVSLLVLLCFQTKFTPTCQIGYIWMFSLIIGFVLLFQRFADHCSKWNLLWLIPFSVIAGWSQEALVIGVGAALVYWWLNHLKAMSLSQWVMMILFGIGALVLCLSPATIHRTGSETGSVDFLSNGAYSIVKLLYYSRASYLIAGLCIYLLVSGKAKFKGLTTSDQGLWIVWVVMLAFNVIVGVFGNRQIFGCELAALLLTVILYRKYARVSSAVGVLIPLMLLAIFIPKMVFNARFLAEDRSVLEQLLQAEASCENGVVYYDFAAKNVTFKDTYPSDVYTWHVLNTLKLNVLPTVCENLSDVRALTISEPATGNITVTYPDGSDQNVSIRRYISLLGKEFNLNVSPLQSFHPAYIGDGGKVYVIYNKVPLTRMVAELD